jgi:hypothetical protein
MAAMAALGSVSAGIQGAVLLAQGRPEGLRYVEPGLDGARRSFWAALICLPMFVALRYADWAHVALPAHVASLDVCGYLIGWVGFALLSRPLVTALGREARWTRFIAAWNWCNVVQYVLLLVATSPGLCGAPPWAQQSAGLIAIGWAVWLEWYAARLTLDAGPLAAAALTCVDLLIGLALSGAISTLVGG